MPNNVVNGHLAAPTATISDIDATGTEGAVFSIGARQNLAIDMDQFAIGSLTNMKIQILTSRDKEQWNFLQNGDGTVWQLTFSANVNTSSPISAGNGKTIPVTDRVSGGNPIPIIDPFVRAKFTSTGSPDTGNSVTYAMVAS